MTMNHPRDIVAAAVLAAAALVAPSYGDQPMRILTYPTGLVTGELEVKVDLGQEAGPAELYLDGQEACSLGPGAAGCTVDLGPDPRVHLLELIGDGGVRVERWVNQPGQEAEVSLLLTPPVDGVCGARLDWAHPERLDPVELGVFLGGRQLKITDGRSVRFPCATPEDAQVLLASAIFADGRRVESVAIAGGFSSETSVELTAVSLVASGANGTCESWPGAAGWPAAARTVPDSGFEVVFVLDPEVRYQPLLLSGWNVTRLQGGGFDERMQTPTVSQPGTGSVTFQQEDDARTPRPSWRKASSTLADAERLWYVAPDDGLHRVNGFAAGRPRWLELLFKFGRAEVPKRPRIADAVAASGLVAAAGPRQRAVVLVLGNKVDERDGSRFSPRQARDYLAELQVPLVVLRDRKMKDDDGWPAGLKTSDMASMARNLERVRELLDRQCMVWLPSRMLSGHLAELLPAGVRPAGLDADTISGPPSMWARAELPDDAPIVEEAILGVPPEGDKRNNAPEGHKWEERLDITAVTVVVSALDRDRRPVADLRAEDLEVLEDAAPVSILQLAPVSAPIDPVEPAATPSAPSSSPPAEGRRSPEGSGELPVALYVNRVLGGGSGLRRALDAVAGEVDRLVALGPVELVVADADEVKTLIEPTRDVSALTAALDQLGAQRAGRNAVERIRKNFVLGVRKSPTAGRAEVLVAATAAASEENLVLLRSLERLRLWALRAAGHRSGLLVVVGGGFDEDPTSFYLSFVRRLEPDNAERARRDLRQRRQAESVGALAQELAGAGWRILAIAGDATAGNTSSVELRRSDKSTTFSSGDFNSLAGTGESPYLLVDPIGSQDHLAAASGGGVTVGSAGLGASLDETRGWYLLTYQVARPPDGLSHALEVQPRRPGITVSTNRVVTAATSEGQAEVRLRRLLAGDPDAGELAVELTHRKPSGSPATVEGKRLRAEVDATVRFGPLAAVLSRGGRGATLRVSVAVKAGDRTPAVEHRLERLATVPESWIYSFPLEWPAAGDSSLAVTVEEPASGLWGGAIIDLGEVFQRPGQLPRGGDGGI